jgi:asparagine synthase (glutamine-hydrolysing)
MCGIAGYLELNNIEYKFDKKSLVAAMVSSIAHRGPDSVGYYCDDQIALGHARLSIIDLSSSANQPMSSLINGTKIVFNGEIYNFKELRKELQSSGVNTWSTNSDTEVILNLYIKWGLDGLKKLEGVFAVAIWDVEKKHLLLIRDRLGVKPLYFTILKSGFGFSSEISSLHKIPNFDDRVDEQSLSEYLWYGNTYGNRTFFSGARQLEPGHYLEISNGEIKIDKWWQIEDYLVDSSYSNDENSATRHLLDVLDNSVSRQMISDVPLALFLSGGLDSSSISASATHSGFEQLNSFSAAFDFEKGVNELSKAKKVADFLGLTHNEIHIDSTRIEDVILRLADAHGEPFADAANIPLYLMCKALPKSIKVVLQGDGGDELFAGYRRYSMLQHVNLFNKIPAGLVNVAKHFGKFGNRFARMSNSVGNTDPAIRMALLLTRETLHDRPEKIFNHERSTFLLQNTDPFLEYKKAAVRFEKFDPIQQMLLTDLTVQLPSQFLTKVDRATMAAGIEARVPLLDEGILKLVLNMPVNWKVRGNNDKIILRNSQINRLPKDILTASKTGFGVPTDYWIANALFKMTRDYILDSSFHKKFDLNNDVIENMLNRHKAGDCNNGFLLWKLLQLSISFR